MSLPRRFLSYDNFELAFTRLIRSGNMEYKQSYRHLFPSYNLALRENLTDLIEDLRRGTYEPEKVTIIFQPKKSGVLRPLTLLSLPDLVVYQAMSNHLAEAFAAFFGRRLPAAPCACCRSRAWLPPLPLHHRPRPSRR